MPEPASANVGTAAAVGPAAEVLALVAGRPTGPAQATARSAMRATTRITLPNTVHGMNQFRSGRRIRTQAVLLELFAASSRSARLLRATFEGAPMTPDEFAVYSLLRFVAPITPARLANALGMQRSTLSNYLARMDERGDLFRRPAPQDGRSSVIELSSDGRARLEATLPHFRAAIVPFTAALGTHREPVLRALAQMNAAFDVTLAGQAAKARAARTRA
jgi:DNA-binding MarR family transcriptional regulator